MAKTAQEGHDLRILPYQQKKEAYEMPGRCGNCGWTGTLLIPKGEKAPSHGLMEHPTTCPNCHVRNLVAVKP
jgi:hypothetical protein